MRNDIHCIAARHASSWGVRWQTLLTIPFIAKKSTIGVALSSIMPTCQTTPAAALPDIKQAFLTKL
eukprot:scaffold50066_cov17-Prasinocladus_malaysianus.AAC.1